MNTFSMLTRSIPQLSELHIIDLENKFQTKNNDKRSWHNEEAGMGKIGMNMRGF